MSPTEQRNKEIIRNVYEASAAGDISALVNVMHENCEELVPPILPWGGIHHGAKVFMTKVLPQVAAALDLSSLRVVSLSADGDWVAALIAGRSALGKDLWIAEHWKLRDGKVLSLIVFYHDTIPLMPGTNSR